MIRGFYAARSGLLAQQSNMDTIAHNLANVSTNGYKTQQRYFSALLIQHIDGGAGSVSAGSGTKTKGFVTDFAPGSLVHTNMEYDFAISGSGFFALQGEGDTERVFTRDGRFQVIQRSGTAYLGDRLGRYVLDGDGQRIALDEAFHPSTVGVFQFANPNGLRTGGGNNFLQTEASGPAETCEASSVRRGYLENSSVNPAEEMVRMIESSKAFSINARVVSTADEMEKTVNQLR